MAVQLYVLYLSFSFPIFFVMLVSGRSPICFLFLSYFLGPCLCPNFLCEPYATTDHRSQQQTTGPTEGTGHGVAAAHRDHTLVGKVGMGNLPSSHAYTYIVHVDTYIYYYICTHIAYTHIYIYIHVHTYYQLERSGGSLLWYRTVRLL